MKKSLFSLIPFLTACAGEPPQNIGVQNGRLAACPGSPNCVSSFESDAEHRIQPLQASLRQVEHVLLGLDEGGALLLQITENEGSLRQSRVDPQHREEPHGEDDQDDCDEDSGSGTRRRPRWARRARRPDLTARAVRRSVPPV